MRYLVSEHQRCWDPIGSQFVMLRRHQQRQP